MAEAARKLMEKGDKALNGFSFFGFGKEQKIENAAEYYQQAAAKFKSLKEFQHAGGAFKKAAEAYEKINSGLEAVQQWKEAGKAYKKDDPESARLCFENAIDYYKDNNRYGQAAKLYVEIAKGFLESGHREAAIDMYNAASECYDADDNANSASKNLIEVAYHSAELKKYDTAIKIYEKVAKDSVDSQLGRWSVKNYLFAAALCHLARAAIADNLETVNDAFESYADLSELFRNTREHNLCMALVTDMQNGSADEFSGHLQDFDEISPLDEWKTNRLLEAKSYFSDDPDFAPDFQNDIVPSESSAKQKSEDDGPDFM